MWRTCLSLSVALLLPVHAASAQPCTARTDEAVDALYRQILERAADPQSAVQARQQLASGRTTVRGLVTGMVRSPEYHVALWAPVVEGLFRQLRNAAPEREHVLVVARSLAERRQTLDDVTVAFAAEEVRAHEPDTAIIAFFTRLLGRAPSEDEVAHFRERLLREGPEAVARTVVESPEYRQRVDGRAAPAPGSPYEPAVRMLYRHLLGRNPDPDGLESSLRLVVDGGFDAVIQAMLGSEEYRQRYGEFGVPGSTIRLCAPVGTRGR